MIILRLVNVTLPKHVRKEYIDRWDFTDISTKDTLVRTVNLGPNNIFTNLENNEFLVPPVPSPTRLHRGDQNV